MTRHTLESRRTGLRVLAAMLLACVTPWLYAAESSEHVVRPPGQPALELHIVLDSSLSRDRRADALARLTAAAEARNGYAQYALGALYRLGDRHPARLLDADDGKAAVYLSHAATQGELMAMAGMAELRLLQGNAREALIWTRLYIHYEEVQTTAALRGNRAYAASLLRRCLQSLANDEELLRRIDADVAAFIERYDAQIRPYIAAQISDDERLRTSMLPSGLREWDPRSSSQRVTEPGMSIYLIAVNPQGRVQHQFVLDSLPNPRVARLLRRHVQQLRFQPTDDSTEPLRWVRAPFGLDTASIRLVECTDDEAGCTP